MRSFLFTCLLSSLVLQGQAQKASKPLKAAQPLKAATQPLQPVAEPPQPAEEPLQITHLSARASMMQGKLVFCYSQPVCPYDVVFTYVNVYTPTETMTLNTIITSSITNALMEAGTQLKAFDAIIIQAGERDIAIKFRMPVANDKKAIATVERHGGFPVFMFCEPVADYQVVKNEKISWYNHLLGGTYYSSARVKDNLVKTANKNKDIEAILFGESASYISFKK